MRKATEQVLCTMHVNHRNLKHDNFTLLNKAMYTTGVSFKELSNIVLYMLYSSTNHGKLFCKPYKLNGCKTNNSSI